MDKGLIMAQGHIELNEDIHSHSLGSWIFQIWKASSQMRNTTNGLWINSEFKDVLRSYLKIFNLLDYSHCSSCWLSRLKYIRYIYKVYGVYSIHSAIDSLRFIHFVIQFDNKTMFALPFVNCLPSVPLTHSLSQSLTHLVNDSHIQSVTRSHSRVYSLYVRRRLSSFK